MSLAADLHAVLDGQLDPDRPWVYRVYDTWEEWVKVARAFLLTRREAWVHHDAAGNETVSLEETPGWWKDLYWQGDMAGVVAFDVHGLEPVKALLYRKVDAETIELVYLQGTIAHNTFFKRLWWNMGFRNATYLATASQHERYTVSHLAEPDELDYEIDPIQTRQRRITIRWKKCAREKCHDKRNPKTGRVGPDDVAPGVPKA